MVIQFPANPAVDTHYYASNKIQYVWDGEKWVPEKEWVARKSKEG